MPFTPQSYAKGDPVLALVEKVPVRLFEVEKLVTLDEMGDLVDEFRVGLDVLGPSRLVERITHKDPLVVGDDSLDTSMVGESHFHRATLTYFNIYFFSV